MKFTPQRLHKIRTLEYFHKYLRFILFLRGQSNPELFFCYSLLSFSSKYLLRLYFKGKKTLLCSVIQNLIYPIAHSLFPEHYYPLH